MNCNYCQKTSDQHNVPYRISNVRERVIPTYCHQPIFQQAAGKSTNVRCTPTFHSTAFNVEGYQPKVNQQLKKDQEKTCEEKTVYKNDSKEKRIQDLNPGVNGCYRQWEGGWYDPAKGELFETLKNFGPKYSRQRKMADLSSNPVFGGVVMEPYQKAGQQTQQQPKAIPAQPEQNQVEVQPEQQQQAQAKPQENSEPKPFEKSGNTNVENAKATQGPKKDIKKEKVPTRPVSAKPVSQPKKSDTKKSTQNYVLNHDVTLCSRGCSAGKKMAKTIVLGSQQPAYTVFRSKRK